MRWLIAPLIAAIAFLGSGWLDALERTTKNSAALARTSEGAPEETQAAADAVGSLPTIADLTDQQASGFRALVEALKLSAERVLDLNATLDEQGRSLETLGGGLDLFRSPLQCVEERLEELVRASDSIPPALADIEATIGFLSRQQDRSIRHLKSINRKLAALGVVAAATDVKVPPPPGDAPPPSPGEPRAGEPC
jgi:hypothetical protein